MLAARLIRPDRIDAKPLAFEEVEAPDPHPGELLVRVEVCGICHTDLHIVEGELPLPRLPITPGHQIVGRVVKTGSAGARFRIGDRVGVPWLYAACGVCDYCRTGRENLCEAARFTGYHVDGGYAEVVVVDERSAHALPLSFPDAHAAPLLCAGVIGFRAFRLCDVRPGASLGLYGFGASAHLVVQIAKYHGCEVLVFTRSAAHRELAEELGASWTGTSEASPPHRTDAAIIFAPAGDLVPQALKNLHRGGTLALAGIHMTPLPAMEYALLYEERTLRSVANSTREDVDNLLALAEKIPLRTEVQLFPFREANDALRSLKESRIRGSGVLVMGTAGATADRRDPHRS